MYVLCFYLKWSGLQRVSVEDIPCREIKIKHPVLSCYGMSIVYNDVMPTPSYYILTVQIMHRSLRIQANP